MIFNELIKVGRNDICPCGSDKKFKKCCLDIISSRPGIRTYEISNEAMPELNNDDNMSPSDKVRFDEIGEAITYNETIDYSNAIIDLNEFKIKYPQAKRVYNLLSICYQMLDQTEKVENLIIESYKKFPNYLFARTGYVGYWMHKGDYGKFDEVFSGCYDLQKLYPERSKFHTSEAFAFFIVCGRYFAEKGRIDTAKIYLKIARELKPHDSQPDIILNEIMLSNLKTLSANTKNKKKLKSFLH
jgi:tetratricopeptide (TPR) repeat protein